MSSPGDIVYFESGFVDKDEARVPISTHAFNYGTGCFEGIRAYWNPVKEQLYVLRLREHAERLLRSAHILHLEPDPTLTQGRIESIILELLARNGYREDVYIRPILYKSGRTIKVTLSGIATDLCVFTQPFGDYLDIRKGLNVMISAWRRIDDNAIPARAKPTGAYINAALASDEARARGFDEAIMLTGDGHVAEASSSNLFLVAGGTVITPQATDDVLVGITRDCVIELVRQRGWPLEVRRVDRSELLSADEAFLSGTGVQLAPITQVDGRIIGNGEIGPLTQELQRAYLQVARGEVEDMAAWRTPVPAAVGGILPGRD
ncbi:MAG: branched-chain amino acid transaminase [Candidatus Dormibacteraeota bacterium]|nr:branched-chain amino acid transaminase [Candidatus Dormibacteraeota bacterium]